MSHRKARTSEGPRTGAAEARGGSAVAAYRAVLRAAVLITVLAPPAHASQSPAFCGAARGGNGGRSSLALFTLKPRDEASQRPDFVTFRSRLKAIVARRDTAGLMKVVDPNVGVAFDGARGLDAFTERHLRNPKEDFWQEFGDVLANGGSFRTAQAFDAPYTFSAWPDGLDAFQCMAIVGAGINIRTAPRLDAPTAAVVDFAIVEWQSTERPVEGWELVTLADGRQGYVATRYLRSPLGYRATFAFKNGQWWIAAFVVGD